METNITTPPVPNIQPPVPQTVKAKEFTWKIINILLGVTAIFALFLLGGWFILSRLSFPPAGADKWQSVVPGKTSKNELVRLLGKPGQETELFLGKGLNYDSGIKTIPNFVLIDQKTEKVKGIFLAISDQKRAKDLYQEMEKLGNPEKVMYSRMFQFSKIYIFVSKGVSYSANEDVKMVDGIHYYQPTTLETYLSEYSSFFANENPFRY